MKRILIATTALSLLVAPLGAAFAQDRHDDRNSMMMDRHDDNRGNAMQMDRRDDHRTMQMDRRDDHRDAMMMDRRDHRDWRRGGRIERADWDRGERIHDWHRYHLSRPPHGYEWRRVDNNYVLAAVAGGVIASVILANH
jgi:Ni/Co efflux regulator RcnB